MLTLHHSRTVSAAQIMFLVLLTGYLAIMIFGLSSYIQWTSVNWVLGSVALFLAAKNSNSYNPLRAGDRGFVSLRYGIGAVLAGVLYSVIAAKTLLFVMLVSAVFFVVESYAGKIGYIPVFCVALMSPMAEYLADLFSFPIRLFLTAVAGSVLKQLNPGTIVQGNMIVQGSSEFSVDPACMGLHMIIASLLAGIMILLIAAQKTARQLHPGMFLFYLVVIMVANLFSNLFRIIFLVLFNIQSKAVLHDFIGLVCFAVYVLLPVFFVARYLVRRFGKIPQRAPFVVNPDNWLAGRINTTHILLMAFTIVLMIKANGHSAYDAVVAQPVAMEGYKSTGLPDGITKLEKAGTLVYIKPIIGFYASDHQPMICWRGSGYEFRRVQEQQVNGTTVYMAQLQRGDDVLYTSWWYAGEHTTTCSQLEWRWQNLVTGELFDLVNVTAGSKPELENEVSKLLKISKKALIK